MRHEQYEETLDAVRQMRKQIIEEFTSNEQEREIWTAQWPFGNWRLFDDWFYRTKYTSRVSREVFFDH